MRAQHWVVGVRGIMPNTLLGWVDLLACFFYNDYAEAE